MTHGQRAYTCSGGPGDPLARALHAPRVTTLNLRPIVRGVWLLTATIADPPPYWCYWLVDGELHATTRVPELTIGNEAGNVELIVSRRGGLDLDSLERVGRARRWRIEWTASPDEVEAYRVEYAVGSPAGEWQTWELLRSGNAWATRRLTPELDDLETYSLRVVPIELGNDGTPATWPARRCVRVPDAPGFGVTYEELTGLVTIAAAS